MREYILGSALEMAFSEVARAFAQARDLPDDYFEGLSVTDSAIEKAEELLIHCQLLLLIVRNSYPEEAHAPKLVRKILEGVLVVTSSENAGIRHPYERTFLIAMLSLLRLFQDGDAADPTLLRGALVALCSVRARSDGPANEAFLLDAQARFFQAGGMP